MNLLKLVTAVAVALPALNFATAHAGAIKNSQNVVGGMLTRAGVKNQEQLSDSQLEELCDQGYSHAYFLYSGASARTISCGRGSISYKSVNWLKTGEVMNAISSGLEGGGRVFVHCNNGAHASGYVAAIALRQFCGYSASAAMNYFDKTNTYGKPPGYGKIKSGLNSYNPISGLSHKANCP